ncbi:hypothetical protein HaLaN_22144 [Haematococcus lacustris]|uniref:Uncharacterized protein n=1 Tax=Haematococcus lacustris TaxID=44745 RepID=A0A699ZNV9_HAELA|nr:hypothetical protein HaLaN_22144 [Haematococcus lacustris]
MAPWLSSEQQRTGGPAPLAAPPLVPPCLQGQGQPTSISQGRCAAQGRQARASAWAQPALLLVFRVHCLAREWAGCARQARVQQASVQRQPVCRCGCLPCARWAQCKGPTVGLCRLPGGPAVPWAAAGTAKPCGSPVAAAAAAAAMAVAAGQAVGWAAAAPAAPLKGSLRRLAVSEAGELEEGEMREAAAAVMVRGTGPGSFETTDPQS